MKISKILAGLSAAALSRSMLSVSALAAENEEAAELPEVVFASADILEGDKGVELNGIALEKDSLAWVQVDTSVDGYDVVTSDAKFSIEMTISEDLEEDTTLFRFINTTEDSKFVGKSAKAYSAGDTIVQTASFTDLIKMIADNDDPQNAWGAGFGMNMQFCVAADVKVYVYDMTYSVPQPEDSSAAPADSSAADSSSESVPESKADSSSAAESKAQPKEETKATNKSTAKNPNTGAGTLAALGIVLAGASVVAVRKRK